MCVVVQINSRNNQCTEFKASLVLQGWKSQSFDTDSYWGGHQILILPREYSREYATRTWDNLCPFGVTLKAVIDGQPCRLVLIV